MKTVLLGRHNISVLCLNEIVKMNDKIIVVTHSDEELSPGGWQMSLKETAIGYNLPLYEPKDVNHSEFLDIIRSFKPDILFSFQFKQILKKDLLDIPRLGCINLHFSLLPQYRGCYPGNWAILNNEKMAGVTLHFMDEGVDTGDIIAQREILLEEDENARSLYDKSTLIGFELFKKIYLNIRKERIPRISQDHKKATHYGLRSIDFKKDARIDWSKSAKKIYAHIRAFTFPPFQYPYTYCKGKKVGIVKSCPVMMGISEIKKNKDGQVVSIDNNMIVIKTGHGYIGILRLKTENNVEISAQKFIKENKIVLGEGLE